MSETGVIALTVVVGTFAILGMTIVIRGVDDSIKVWGSLGVAFGAIISFYFTSNIKDQSRRHAVAAVKAANDAEVASLKERISAFSSSLHSINSSYNNLD